FFLSPFSLSLSLPLYLSLTPALSFFLSLSLSLPPSLSLSLSVSLSPSLSRPLSPPPSSRAKNVEAQAPAPVRFFAAEAPVVDLYLGQLEQVERLRAIAEVS